MCGKCIKMLTEEENSCCQEMPKVTLLVKCYSAVTTWLHSKPALLVICIDTWAFASQGLLLHTFTLSFGHVYNRHCNVMNMTEHKEKHNRSSFKFLFWFHKYGNLRVVISVNRTICVATLIRAYGKLVVTVIYIYLLFSSVVGWLLSHSGRLHSIFKLIN